MAELARIDEALAVLADPQRRKVVDLLSQGPLAAGDLSRALGGGAPAMSRHLKLMKQMKSSEAKLKPVVQAFRDQVLYLKHNLNARAINSLKKTVIEIDDDIAALVKDIDASNAEADRAIAGLKADS